MKKKIEIPLNMFNKAYVPFMYKTKKHNVLKGGRASGKTDAICTKLLLYLAMNPGKNLKVIVQTAASIRFGLMRDLLKVAERLNLKTTDKDNIVFHTVSPLEIRIQVPGKKPSLIHFQGSDNPHQAKGVGGYDILWFEEADAISFEFYTYMVGSFREPGRDGAIYVSFNPEREEHWLKTLFFDKEEGSDFVKHLRDKNGKLMYDKAGNPVTVNTWKTAGGLDADEIQILETTFKDNHFGGDYRARKAVLDLLELKKRENENQWRVWAFGDWGTTGNRVFSRFVVDDFDRDTLLRSNPYLKISYGMDKGTKDPFTFVKLAFDMENKKLYVLEDKMWLNQDLPDRIVSDIIKMGYQSERIFIDSADPMTTNYMRQYGLYRIENAKKPPNSIDAGIKFLKQFDIIVHASCTGTLRELQNHQYVKKYKADKITSYEAYEDGNNHFIDAMRYAAQVLDYDSEIQVMSSRDLGFNF